MLSRGNYNRERSPNTCVGSHTFNQLRNSGLMLESELGDPPYLLQNSFSQCDYASIAIDLRLFYIRIVLKVRESVPLY